MMANRRNRLFSSLLLIATMAFSPFTAMAMTATAKLQIFPQEFQGLGDIALLISNDGISGGNLYTILNAHGLVHSYFAQSHVIAAKFSSDGEWMSTSVIQNNQLQNWLISADGKAKINLGTTLYAGAFDPQGHTYYYSTFGGKFYRITPPGKPVLLHIKLSPNSRITGISFYNHQQALLSVTENDHNYTDDYDQIASWTSGSNAIRPLLKSTPPNGLILGPWVNPSTFFYWYDPYHSASIAADGLPLYVYQNGKSMLISHTYTSTGSVLPVNKNSAILWENSSRSFFLGFKESLIFWPHQPLKLPPHLLAMFPALNPTHTDMTVVVGNPYNSRQANSGQAINRWFSTLQLATLPLQGGTLTVLKSAGSGVMDPSFDASGHRIVYSLFNQAVWISASGKGSKHVIAKVTPSTTQNQLQIAAYLP